jgi:hypothetical protein
VDQQELQKYLSILSREPCGLYPTPEGMDEAENRFRYVRFTATHLIIENIAGASDHLSTAGTYKINLPLALIEFVNPRVLRLTRPVRAYNGSFV